MTDNEIIKALKKHSMDLCSNCKVEKTTLCNNCISEIERNALDLINRQQAEIEKLQNQAKRLKQYDEERDIRLHERLTEKAKAEGIKEFWGKLKEKQFYEYIGEGWEGYLVGVDDGDNLLKKMTEKGGVEG